MKIVFEPVNIWTRWPCSICNGRSEKLPVLGVAYTDDGEKIGDVCEECIKAGPDGMRKRAFEKADIWEEDARMMRELATRLQGENIDTPDFQALERAIQKHEEEMYGPKPLREDGYGLLADLVTSDSDIPFD